MEEEKRNNIIGIGLIVLGLLTLITNSFNINLFTIIYLVAAFGGAIYFFSLNKKKSKK